MPFWDARQGKAWESKEDMTKTKILQKLLLLAAIPQISSILLSERKKSAKKLSFCVSSFIFRKELFVFVCLLQNLRKVDLVLAKLYLHTSYYSCYDYKVYLGFVSVTTSNNNNNNNNNRVETENIFNHWKA